MIDGLHTRLLTDWNLRDCRDTRRAVRRNGSCADSELLLRFIPDAVIDGQSSLRKIVFFGTRGLTVGTRLADQNLPQERSLTAQPQPYYRDLSVAPPVCA